MQERRDFHTDRQLARPGGWWRRFSVKKPGLDWLTLVCLCMVVIHLIVESQGGVVHQQVLYQEMLGLSGAGMDDGKAWQLVSYAFLHGSWFHLVTNVVMMWVVGGRLLSFLPSTKVFAAWLRGVVLGGIGFLGFDAWQAGGQFLVGASGGAFSLFIMLAMLSPDARVYPLRLKARNLAVGMMAASLMLCLMHPSLKLPVASSAGLWFAELGMASIFLVAHACHFAGGMAGWAMARKTLGKQVSLEQLQRERRLRE